MLPEDEEDFRSAWNERGVATEAIACRLASRLHLLHLLKLWLANRLPVPLLLACLPHSLIAEGLALLAERHRAWYVRHRAALLTVALVQMAWTVAKLATDGAMDAAYRAHRGSAAALLLLIILTNFTFGLLVPNVYMRLRLARSAASLLLQAALLLRASRGMCQRVLLAPGVAEPLSHLFWALDAAHILTSAAALLLAGSAPLTSHSPQAAPSRLRQCTIINAWTTLLGAALALAAVHRLEARARREYAARRAASRDQLPSRLPRGARKPPILPLSGWWPADLFLLSCCMWQAAALLVHWLVPD